MNKNELITLLTTSCKAYEDVLEIHEFLYKRHWPDCPFHRVLVMDEVTQDGDYLKSYDEVIVAGRETGRKNHLRVTMALEKITSPYVIFLQEDMLLNERVNSDLIVELTEKIHKYDAGAIRLFPFYGADRKYDNDMLEEVIINYPINTPYRISYAPSIWDREYLLDISRNYEYGADFERKGTELSKKLDKRILGYKYVAYPYINGILRGKWEIPAIRFLGYYGIEPDLSKHGLMDSKDLCKQGLMGYVYNTNPDFIMKMQRLFQIGKKN